MNDYIAKLLVDTNCYVNSNKTEDKTIRTPDGNKVPAYLSCRLAISDVKTREIIENEITKLVEENYLKDVTIIGMATAGITWAHAIADKLKLPLLYIRSSEKSYGLKGFIEGNLEKTFKKVILVDDVLYTGETISKAQNILKEIGFEVIGVVCIANLRTSTYEKLKGQNIKVFSLTDYKSILKYAKDKKMLNQEEYEIMKNIYEENYNN